MSRAALNRFNLMKTLSLVSIVATLLVYAVMGVSGYTAAAALSSSLMGLSGSNDDNSFIKVINNSDRSMTFEFNLPAQNPGLLEINAILNSTIISEEGIIITNEIASQPVPPSSTTYLSFTMYVPSEIAETFESHPPTLIIEIRCRTLFQLVEMGISVEITEGFQS